MSRDFRSVSLGYCIALLLGLGLMGCSSEKVADGGKEPVNLVLNDTAVVDTSPEAEIKRLSDQIKLSPKDYDLFYRRSVNWYDAGNTFRAMDDMNKSIELNNMNPEAYYMRGFYHYVQNQDDAALKDLNRAINVNTDNPEVFYLIGQIHFFRKEYKDAQDAYEAAAKIDSLQPTYSFALGFMEQERGNTTKAIKYYEEALQKNPAFIKGLSALHDIYLNEKGRPDLAMAYNDRIMLVDSTHPVGRFNMGNFFFNKAGNITAEEKLPEFQVLMKLAISEYSICIQNDPDFVQGYYNRGYSYYLIEQYNRASDDFSTVINLDPYNTKAYFMRASIQEFQGDLNGALVNYQQAEKLDPNFREARQAVKEVQEKLKTASGDGAGSMGG